MEDGWESEEKRVVWRKREKEGENNQHLPQLSVEVIVKMQLKQRGEGVTLERLSKFLMTIYKNKVSVNQINVILKCP